MTTDYAQCRSMIPGAEWANGLGLEMADRVPNLPRAPPGAGSPNGHPHSARV